MRILIQHDLSFSPSQGSMRAIQQLLLTPRSGSTQTVGGWTIDMPGMAEASTFFDGFGNTCHLVCQNRPEGEIRVQVSGVVETLDRNGVLGRIDNEPVPALFKRRTRLSEADEVLTDALRSYDIKTKRIALLHDLMSRLSGLMDDEAEEEAASSQSQSQDGNSQSQSQSQAQSGPKPTPVDLAHRFIGVARALDIPARFVSGYLLGEGDTESADLHAWAEAFDPGLGWIAFDPSLGYCPTEFHVRLATGLDRASTAPIRCCPSTEPPRLVGLSVTREGRH